LTARATAAGRFGFRYHPPSRDRAQRPPEEAGGEARLPDDRERNPMEELMRFPAAVRRDARVDAWFEITDPFRALVRPWFERLRALGPDVRELIHDHCPTACIGDAALAYVAAYRGHAAVGFFHGAGLPDPAGLLEGAGKRMRHVKLRSGAAIDTRALEQLIEDAAADLRRRTA
jgi:hypothetical protein